MNPITKEGEVLLREELKKLKSEDRPRIIDAIASAREFGDLKENAEYHAAKEEQSLAEARIRDIESKLSSAQVIDVTTIESSDKVIFGTTVKVYNSNLFLGSELQDTYNVVSAIIGPLTPNKNNDFNSILIQDYYWPIYLAYYKPTLELDRPEYTESAKLQENGVILEYIIDYGNFSIISILKKISSVNNNSC